MANMTESNLVTLDTTLVEGQRCIRIGDSIIPVGVGSKESPGTLKLYKCASYTAPSSSGIVVSGAGTTECNGTYTLVDSTATGTNRVWQNSNSYQIKWNKSTWRIFDTVPVEVYQGNNTTYSTTVEPWELSYLGATKPYPTVAQGSASPGSWSGYLGLIDSSTGVFSWSSTVTENLEVGGSITPVVNGVYNKDATIKFSENLSAENIKNGVSLLGVSGTMAGKSATVTQPNPTVSFDSSSGVVTASYTPVSGDVSDTTEKSATYNIPTQTAQTITPTTSEQTIASGKFLTGTQTIAAVTSSIDNNISASNIKKDVAILGVTGTYEGEGSSSGDTWYKCASVTQGSAGGVVVSGAGTTAVNGTYTLANSTATGGDRIWANTNGIKLKCTNGVWEFCTDNGDAYYYYGESSGAEIEDPWDVTWKITDGTNPVPSVVESQASSWSGYLATIASTGITYASSVTSGLTFSSTTPEVNGIYNANVTKRIYEDSLLASNIKNGVSLFGVTGTMESADSWYRCASVTQGSSGYVVSGAGTSNINGTYTLVDSAKTGRERVWQNSNGFKIMIDSDIEYWTISDSEGSRYYAGGDGTETDPPTSEWWSSMYGEDPAPTIAEQNSAGSWSGYLASFDSSTGILSWASSATSDLSIGGSITPVVNGVYNSNATKQMTLNLLASNIKKDVAILGTTGTYEGNGIFDVYKISATSPLTGYKAVGYSSGTWTWDTSTTSLSAGTATPTVDYAFVANGTTIIGDSIEYAGIVPQNNLYFAKVLSASSASGDYGPSVSVHGTVTFTTVDNVPAAYINGAGNYVGDAAIPLEKVFTLCAWLKPSGGNALVTLTAGTWGSAGNEIWCLFNSVGEIQMTNGGESSHIMAETTASTSIIHFLTFVFNDGVCKIYVDGTLVVTNDPGYSVDMNGTRRLSIGSLDRATSAVGGNGYYSAVRLYTRELTTSEITALASEFTPEQSMDQILVSGAGTTACNGTYTIVDATATGYNRVWANGEIQIVAKQIGSSYTWAITGADEYYMGADLGENPWDIGWMISALGADPAPTVTHVE